MSDANQLAIHTARESAYATLATSGTNPDTLRFTSESFKQNTATTQSAEIVATRDIKEILRNDASAGGGFGFELSWGTYDEILAELLQDDNDWAAAVVHSPPTDGGDYSFNTSGTISVVSGGFSTLKVGEWIEVTQATSASNNKKYKLVGISGNDLTVSPAPGATESGVTATQIEQLEYLNNGTTKRSRTFQKVFSDLAIDDLRYTGKTCDVGDLEITATGIVTGNYGFLGALETEQSNALATDIGGGATLQAATTTGAMNAVDDVVQILEAGAAYQATGLTCAIANGLRAQNVIANLGPIGYGVGTFLASGTHNAFFATHTVMAKYRGFTSSSLAVEFDDAAGSGNLYIFEWPEIKYTDAQAVAGGRDTDIIAELTWEAQRDPVEGVTMRIVRDAA